MSDNNSGLLCALGGWGMAILAGFLAAVLLMILGDWRLIQAIFAGIVIAVLVGAFMSWVVCRPLPAPGEIPKSNASTNPARTTQQTARDAADTAKSGGGAAAATAAAGGAAAGAAVAASGSAADDGSSDSDASQSTSASGSDGSDTVGSSSIVKPSTPLAGSDELASRKGTWTYSGDDGAASSDTGAADAASGGAAAKADGSGAAADAADGSGAGDSKAQSVLAAVESTDTLDSSEIDDSASIEATPSGATAPSANAGDVDYDNDGIIEGKDEGTKPEALSGPRDGKADNLKEIKGIGPKLEILCNELGFYHFDQIANWTADEVAWVNANLAGFKGRVSRDNWVDQAKILAAGGETEFSKRVDDGDVY